MSICTKLWSSWQLSWQLTKIPRDGWGPASPLPGVIPSTISGQPSAYVPELVFEREKHKLKRSGQAQPRHYRRGRKLFGELFFLRLGNFFWILVWRRFPFIFLGFPLFSLVFLVVHWLFPICSWIFLALLFVICPPSFSLVVHVVHWFSSGQILLLRSLLLLLVLLFLFLLLLL